MIFASNGSIRLTVANKLKLFAPDSKIRITRPDGFFGALMEELGRCGRSHKPDDLLADGCPSIATLVTDAEGNGQTSLRNRGFNYELRVHAMTATSYVEMLRGLAGDLSGYERNAISNEIEMILTCAATHVLVDLEFVRPTKYAIARIT